MGALKIRSVHSIRPSEGVCGISKSFPGVPNRQAPPAYPLAVPVSFQPSSVLLTPFSWVIKYAYQNAAVAGIAMLPSIAWAMPMPTQAKNISGRQFARLVRAASGLGARGFLAGVVVAEIGLAVLRISAWFSRTWNKSCSSARCQGDGSFSV